VAQDGPNRRAGVDTRADRRAPPVIHPKQGRNSGEPELTTGDSSGESERTDMTVSSNRT
jgi:hypothetical protein